MMKTVIGVGGVRQLPVAPFTKGMVFTCSCGSGTVMEPPSVVGLVTKEYQFTCSCGRIYRSTASGSFNLYHRRMPVLEGVEVQL